jgi:hypothetical protein
MAVCIPLYPLFPLTIANFFSVSNVGWDRGYQHTAYFLDYLEERFGEGTVRRLNEKLRRHEYKDKSFWSELLGQSVDELYGDYVEKSKCEE